jgi:hypothetical protein
MHPTPLRVDKIVRILKAKFFLTALPIFWCGAGDEQSVGWRSIDARRNEHPNPTW